jgi:hypothetical protein
MAQVSAKKRSFLPLKKLGLFLPRLKAGFFQYTFVGKGFASIWTLQ